MKHTTGKVIISDLQTDMNLCSAPFFEIGSKERYFWIARVQNFADAQLIADAFNATNETGKTPKQLAEIVNTLIPELAEEKAKNAEILEALNKCKGIIGNIYDGLHTKAEIQIISIINKATSHS